MRRKDFGISGSVEETLMCRLQGDAFVELDLVATLDRNSEDWVIDSGYLSHLSLEGRFVVKPVGWWLDSILWEAEN